MDNERGKEGRKEGRTGSWTLRLATGTALLQLTDDHSVHNCSESINVNIF